MKVGNVKFFFLSFQLTLLTSTHCMNILIRTVEIIDLKRITYLVSSVTFLWKMFLRSNIHTLAISPPSSKRHRSPLLQHPFCNGSSRNISSRLRLVGGWYGEGQFQLLNATFLHLEMLASTLIGYKGCM